jgi:hypothetical protein
MATLQVGQKRPLEGLARQQTFRLSVLGSVNVHSIERGSIHAHKGSELSFECLANVEFHSPASFSRQRQLEFGHTS